MKAEALWRLSFSQSKIYNIYEQTTQSRQYIITSLMHTHIQPYIVINIDIHTLLHKYMHTYLHMNSMHTVHLLVHCNSTVNNKAKLIMYTKTHIFKWLVQYSEMVY